MEEITKYSVTTASEDAVKLWALSSAQYPFRSRMIQEFARVAMIDVVSSFALNARRAMEPLGLKTKYPLHAARWEWSPLKEQAVVTDLRDALNRIIHAQKLQVGFERIPDNISRIDGGAFVIPYIEAATDQRKLSFIDPFSLSHAFLFDVIPAIY